jgi:hypothetical protein
VSDSLEVARTLRDRATSPGLREYWQQVIDGIEKRRAEEKEKKS